MMKDVLLIEDRVHRQQNLLGLKLKQLDSFPILTNISGGEAFADIKIKLNRKEYSIFQDYSTIMLHRSAFEAEVRNGLLDYLKNYPKKLVFFSGGISGSQISKLKNIEFMLINVTDFYSENLLTFLSNNGKNLQELAFGSNWKVSILIDSVGKLTLYEKNFNQKPWVTVEEDLQLSNIIIDKYFFELSKKPLVNKDEINFVLTQMRADLKTIL